MAQDMSVWATLFPVIVGGVIGVAGGLAGPPLMHWLTDRSNRKKKRAEKLEELISVLYAHEYWLQIVRTIRMQLKDTAEPAPPLPKGEAIAAVYFPQYSRIISELETLATNYERWMIDAGQKRLDNAPADQIAKGFSDIYKPYKRKFNEVIQLLKEYAKSEFTDLSR